MGRPKKKSVKPSAKPYQHPEADCPMRPEVGTQRQFKKRKEPTTYTYDSSLSPALEWDGQNPSREEGEVFIKAVLDATSLEDAKAAAANLKAISDPFLNWSGKAERISFGVPTLPLFVHERLSTTAIVETLKKHRKQAEQQRQSTLLELFADPQHSIVDQVLRAYEYRDKWVNRMVLGDSLVVMNSLLQYEGLGGQIQMIYMDPPYGVKFGSNFQPFVRKRDVKHNDDDNMTREPEMVKAYRDTWELGLHSYLTYMRDRVLLCRELISPTGSIFIQIGDENVHHVREIMDEVFGEENFCAAIAIKKTGVQSSLLLPRVYDTILWYAKDINRVKYNALYYEKVTGEGTGKYYNRVLEEDGSWRSATDDEITNGKTADGRWLFSPTPLTSDYHGGTGQFDFKFDDRIYTPPPQSMWKTTVEGMERLRAAKRIVKAKNSLRFVRYINDFPVTPLTSIWEDLGAGSFTENRIYVVQTRTKILRRCILLTTDPGDLVLDPTCGSGTTAYVAEQWGRRWITIDVSRVPLALARQRLLTATFLWYQLHDVEKGPAAGFVYQRRQNRKGEEVGGIVPHITLKSIANDETPDVEVLVDHPEIDKGIIRVSGPFTFEATIPTPLDLEGSAEGDTSPAGEMTELIGAGEGHSDFIARMLEVLRQSPVLQLGGARSVTLRNIRPPAKTLSLSAEATVAGDDKNMAVALVFGPENGAVSQKLVYEAAMEAHAKGYTHLYVIGFAIQPNARSLIDNCEEVEGIPATYVQATPDILMGDLLKNMRSSQIFSVCGLPEARVFRKDGRYQVKLLGLDLFDPTTMEAEHHTGSDVPAWFLDTDYNSMCFHVSQAFFPRTGAWNSLKRALKATHEESVWDHLAGTVSAPFDAGEHGLVAIKVIDDRGNELMVVKSLEEA